MKRGKGKNCIVTLTTVEVFERAIKERNTVADSQVFGCNLTDAVEMGVGLDPVNQSAMKCEFTDEESEVGADVQDCRFRIEKLFETVFLDPLFDRPS